MRGWVRRDEKQMTRIQQLPASVLFSIRQLKSPHYQTVNGVRLSYDQLRNRLPVIDDGRGPAVEVLNRDL